jgi:FtsH-binding integral membrane protein
VRHRPLIGSVTIRSIYFITAAGLLGAGLGFILGPARWRSSPSYTVAAQIMPIMAWAWVMVCAGLWKAVAYAARARAAVRFGSALGGSVALAWGTALVLSAITGALTGWSGVPAWLTVAGVQLAGAAEWAPGH